LLQIAQGLSHAHKSNLVHRDLTPNNIFLVGDEKKPTAKIIDFGLSRALVDSETKLTKTGFIIGTPEYMSPEATRGQTPDLRSDIYSYGCIMYEALSGKIPLESETPIGYLRLQQYSYPTEPNVSWSDKKKERLLKQIILRCIQKEPELRFPSCDEIVKALTAERASPTSTELPLNEGSIHPWSDSAARQQRRLLRIRILLASTAILVSSLIFCFQDKLLQLTAKVLVSSRSSLFEREEIAFASDLKNKGHYSSAAMLYGDLERRAQARRQHDKEVTFGIREAECYFSEEKYTAACRVLNVLLLRTQKFPDSSARDSALLKAFEMTDQNVRTGPISRSELELRARLLLLISESHVLHKGDYMKRSEQKLLGLVVQYGSSLPGEEASQWQNLDDDPLKNLIIPAVLSVINDPKFVMNDEQQALIGRTFLAHSVAIRKAELENPAMSDEQKHLALRQYLVDTCGKDLGRLRAELEKLVNECRKEMDAKAEWPAICQLASVDASLKHYDLAFKEVAQAEDLERQVEEVIIGKADLEELRIYMLLGDRSKAKAFVQELCARLDKMKPLYNPDKAEEIIQHGRGRSRFAIKTLQSAYRRAFEALSIVNEPEKALQIWSELVAFDDKYKPDNITPSDRAGDFQPLLDLAKSGQITDPRIVKSIDDIAKKYKEAHSSAR
jgi:hypothetical protein